MSIRQIFQCYCYIVGTSFHFEMLFSTEPINLVVEEISWNKTVVQTSLTCFTNQKEKHVSIRHNGILTLIKSGVPFFRIDIIYIIYLDVKYFLVVCLSIYHEKRAVKTTLTAIRHFFSKKLKFCPSRHNLKLNYVKMVMLETHFRIFNSYFCISLSSRREIRSPRMDLGN